jgi:hypothetical protein
VVTLLETPIQRILGRRPRSEVMGAELYGSHRGYIRNALAGSLVGFQAVVDLPDGPRHHQVTYLPDTISDERVAGFFALTMESVRNAFASYKIATRIFLTIST